MTFGNAGVISGPSYGGMYRQTIWAGVSPKIWARVCICLPLPEKMICKCDGEDGTDEGEVTNPSIDYCIAIQPHHFLHQGEESWKIAITYIIKKMTLVFISLVGKKLKVWDPESLTACLK